MPKGGDFENKLCRIFSIWFSGGKSRFLFARSSQSGGQASYAAKKAREKREGKLAVTSTGDIVAVDSQGMGLTDRVIVEAKKGYDDKIKMPNCFFKHDNLFWTFVDQAKRASIDKFNESDRWWLVFKQDFQPTWIFMPDTEFQLIDDLNKQTHVHIDHKEHGRIVFLELETMLENTLPNTILPIERRVRLEQTPGYKYANRRGR